MADDAEKTEPATDKRKQDARRKGEVAQSREIASVLVLSTVLGAVLLFVGERAAVYIGALAESAWGSAGSAAPSTLGDVHAVLLATFGGLGPVVLPLMLLMMVVAVLSQIAQTGPMLASEALQFRGSRIDPIQGMKRLMNVDRLVDLAKSFLKMAIVGGICWWILQPAAGEIIALTNAGIGEGLRLAGSLGLQIATSILLAMAALAAFDVGWVRYRYEKKLRMTKQEVRDELKQREGSPQVRSRIRSTQRELTRLRMISEVPRADVVVTNPTHFAVALRYERTQMRAPSVVAKGRGFVALRIREVAKSHGVPIVENAPLAQILHKTATVGREVPEKLYQAVAEVLAYVYRLDPRRASSWGVAS